MGIQIINKEIEGVLQIKPFLVSDQRGKAVKEYDREEFEQCGINFEPFESMVIESKKNTLRGVHFQYGEKQNKIVRCVKGLVWAVAVDLRAKSATCGKWVEVDINHDSEIYLPGGCAFGTLALMDSIIFCMFGEAYDETRDSGIRWNDETLSIKWPLDKLEGELIISDKDSSLITFDEYLIGMGLA